ncbi:MAG: mechanosensitive ion channel family protein [Myxococcales bacterium]|nr:mechanosensitive ion channel family protein [Myxococcales bacterium]
MDALDPTSVSGLQELVQFIDFDRLPYAVLVALVGFALLVGFSRLLDDMGERFTDRRLTFKQIKALGRFFLYLAIPTIVASSVLRLESQALFAVAGSISVAVGFAFKDLLGSLIAGVILLFDRPFQVGDRISFGGFYGEVQEIGLRSVRLATLDDNLVTIPNSKFLTDEVASANAGQLDAMVVVPFYVAAAEDFQRARRIVAEATSTSRYAYLKKPVVTVVEDRFLGERFVTVITAKAYVFDVRYEKAFVTDVTERVKVALRAAGVRTPDQQYRDLDLHDGREAR